jgi:hypothetical protein
MIRLPSVPRLCESTPHNAKSASFLADKAVLVMSLSQKHLFFTVSLMYLLILIVCFNSALYCLFTCESSFVSRRRSSFVNAAALVSCALWSRSIMLTSFSYAGCWMFNSAPLSIYSVMLLVCVQSYKDEIHVM